MNKKRIEKKPKRNLCIAIIAIAVALAFLVPTSAVFANDVNLTITNVRFDPPSQTVEKGETFTVSYYVEPTDWVIGANFVTITFDPILLEANEVTEGTLFGGDAFLFEGGTIDNVAGTISEGFACVKVENNVSTPGSIFVIEFTAKDKIGTSSLVMSGVEVHGIGGILPITVESGSVTVEGVEKVWDLYAKWESDDPTNVMISWNNNEFNSCEYNNITLMQYDPFDMEWDFAADMLVATSYVYTPRWFNEQWLNDQFQIRATWNNPPNTPSNPNPSDSITDVDINADLNWTCDEFVWNVTLNFNEDNGNRDYVVFGEAPDANDGEPPDSYDMPKPPAPQPPYIRAWFDDNLPIPYDKLGEDYRNCGVTYDVYFGSSSPPPLIISRHSQTTYDPGKLDYGTQYYWQIVAWDNYGASISGPIWSFTTEGSDDNGGNGGGNGGGTTTNLPPVADANGPYIGAIGIPVTFDGSSSSDPDGDITNYTWHFGDGTEGYEEITDHIYAEAGNYTVTLLVTDNGGIKRSNLTYALITGVANNPPSMPVVTGSTMGQKNISYNYTAMSTDPDNDTIRYFFDWGDGTNTTSNFFASGTIYNTSHNWTTSGVYTVRVYAKDENNGVSGTTEVTIFIDVNKQFIDDVIQGYLLDTDNDGIYDIFHNNATGCETALGQDDDGNYLIDVDGDGDWDYTFDLIAGLSTYQKEEEQKKTPGFELIIIVCAVAVFLFWKRKKIVDI